MRGSFLIGKRARPWLAALAAGLAGLGLWAGWMRDWRAGRPPRPVIELSTHEVDYGRLRPLQQVERVITVVNRGRDTLRMQEPTATCGCQKPRLGRLVLGPGERTELHLSQQARQESGPFQHVVGIKSNDPMTPEAALYLMGVVSSGVVVRPEPLVFDPMGPGESRTRYLEVASDDGAPFRLTYQRAEGRLRAKAVLDRLGAAHRVEVTLQAGATCGPIRESFVLNTDRPETLPLVIVVTGAVVGPIRVVPEALTLGSVWGYQEVKRKVSLRGTRGTFVLQDVKPPPGGWRLRYTGGSGSKAVDLQVVELTIRVPDTPGLIQGVLQFELRTDSGPEVLELPVSGVISGHAAEGPRQRG